MPLPDIGDSDTTSAYVQHTPPVFDSQHEELYWQSGQDIEERRWRRMIDAETALAEMVDSRESDRAQAATLGNRHSQLLPMNLLIGADEDERDAKECTLKDEEYRSAAMRDDDVETTMAERGLTLKDQESHIVAQMEEMANVEAALLESEGTLGRVEEQRQMDLLKSQQALAERERTL
jgi:hypothetical protein